MVSIIEEGEVLSERLPVPKLDSALTESEKELWSIRLPQNLSLKHLKEPVTLKLLEGVSKSVNARNKFKIEETEYALALDDDSLNNSSIRLLVPDDDEDEEDGKQYFMKLSRPFHRHVAIFQLDGLVNEEDGMDEKESIDMKRAYLNVPQATNMKRRWIVPGQHSFGHESRNIPVPPLRKPTVETEKPKVEQSKMKTEPSSDKSSKRKSSDSSHKSSKKKKKEKKEKKSSKKKKKD